MTKTGSLLAFIFFAIFAMQCRSKGSDAELNDMKKLVWDLQRTEDFVTQYAIRDSALNQDSLLRQKFAQVYALHKTSEKAFLEKMNEYRANPVLLRRLMDSVFQYGSRYRENATIPDTAFKKVKQVRKIADEQSLQ